MAPKKPTLRPGKPGGVREQNRLRKEKQIEDAALALFLERGVTTVTIDDITQRAEVAKGSFYRYYESKLELIEKTYAPISALLQDTFETAHDEVGHAKSSWELTAVYSSLTIALMPLLQSPDHVRLYLQEMRNPAGPFGDLRREIEELALSLTQHAIEIGVLTDVGAQTSSLAVLGAIESLLLAHLEGRLEDDLLSTTRNLITMVMQGLSASRG